MSSNALVSSLMNGNSRLPMHSDSMGYLKLFVTQSSLLKTSKKLFVFTLQGTLEIYEMNKGVLSKMDISHADIKSFYSKPNKNEEKYEFVIEYMKKGKVQKETFAVVNAFRKNSILSTLTKLKDGSNAAKQKAFQVTKTTLLGQTKPYTLVVLGASLLKKSSTDTSTIWKCIDLKDVQTIFLHPSQPSETFCITYAHSSLRYNIYSCPESPLLFKLIQQSLSDVFAFPLEKATAMIQQATEQQWTALQYSQKEPICFQFEAEKLKLGSSTSFKPILLCASPHYWIEKDPNTQTILHCFELKYLSHLIRYSQMDHCFGLYFTSETKIYRYKCVLRDNILASLFAFFPQMEPSICVMLHTEAPQEGVMEGLLVNPNGSDTYASILANNVCNMDKFSMHDMSKVFFEWSMLPMSIMAPMMEQAKDKKALVKSIFKLYTQKWNHPSSHTEKLHLLLVVWGWISKGTVTKLILDEFVNQSNVIASLWQSLQELNDSHQLMIAIISMQVLLQCVKREASSNSSNSSTTSSNKASSTVMQLYTQLCTNDTLQQLFICLESATISPLLQYSLLYLLVLILVHAPVTQHDMVLQYCMEHRRCFYQISIAFDQWKYFSKTTTLSLNYSLSNSVYSQLILLHLLSCTNHAMVSTMQEELIVEGYVLYYLHTCLQREEFGYYRQTSMDLVNAIVNGNSKGEFIMKQVIPKVIMDRIRSNIVTHNSPTNSSNGTTPTSPRQSKSNVKKLIQKYSVNTVQSVKYNYMEALQAMNVEVIACAETIWNEKTHFDLCQSLQYYIHQIQSMKQTFDSNPILFHVQEFTISYPSLQDELQINQYFIRYMTHTTFTQIPILENPLPLARELYYRLILLEQSNEAVQLACSKSLSFVYSTYMAEKRIPFPHLSHLLEVLRNETVVFSFEVIHELLMLISHILSDSKYTSTMSSKSVSLMIHYIKIAIEKKDSNSHQVFSMASVALDILSKMALFRTDTLQPNDVIRPIPKAIISMSKTNALPFIVRLILESKEHHLQMQTLRLLHQIARINDIGLQDLYKTGFYYFIFAKCADQIVGEYAVKTIQLTCQKQEEFVLESVLPKHLVTLLCQQGMEFVKLFYASTVTPVLIWTDAMRQTLIETCQQHVDASLVNQYYTYSPLTPIVYEELQQEIEVGGYFLKTFLLPQFRDSFVIDNPQELFEQIVTQFITCESTQDLLVYCECQIVLLQRYALQVDQYKGIAQCLYWLSQTNALPWEGYEFLIGILSRVIKYETNRDVYRQHNGNPILLHFLYVTFNKLCIEKQLHVIPLFGNLLELLQMDAVVSQPSMHETILLDEWICKILNYGMYVIQNNTNINLSCMSFVKKYSKSNWQLVRKFWNSGMPWLVIQLICFHEVNDMRYDMANQILSQFIMTASQVSQVEFLQTQWNQLLPVSLVKQYFATVKNNVGLGQYLHSDVENPECIWNESMRQQFFSWIDDKVAQLHEKDYLLPSDKNLIDDKESPIVYEALQQELTIDHIFIRLFVQDMSYDMTDVKAKSFIQECLYYCSKHVNNQMNPLEQVMEAIRNCLLRPRVKEPCIVEILSQSKNIHILFGVLMPCKHLTVKSMQMLLLVLDLCTQSSAFVEALQQSQVMYQFLHVMSYLLQHVQQQTFLDVVMNCIKNCITTNSSLAMECVQTPIALLLICLFTNCGIVPWTISTAQRTSCAQLLSQLLLKSNSQHHLQYLFPNQAILQQIQQFPQQSVSMYDDNHQTPNCIWNQTMRQVLHQFLNQQFHSLLKSDPLPPNWQLQQPIVYKEVEQELQIAQIYIRIYVQYFEKKWEWKVEKKLELAEGLVEELLKQQSKEYMIICSLLFLIQSEPQLVSQMDCISNCALTLFTMLSQPKLSKELSIMILRIIYQCFHQNRKFMTRISEEPLLLKLVEKLESDLTSELSHLYLFVLYHLTKQSSPIMNQLIDKKKDVFFMQVLTNAEISLQIKIRCAFLLIAMAGDRQQGHLIREKYEQDATWKTYCESGLLPQTNVPWPNDILSLQQQDLSSYNIPVGIANALDTYHTTPRSNPVTPRVPLQTIFTNEVSNGEQQPSLIENTQQLPAPPPSVAATIPPPPPLL